MLCAGLSEFWSCLSCSASRMSFTSTLRILQPGRACPPSAALFSAALPCHPHGKGSSAHSYCFAVTQPPGPAGRYCFAQVHGTPGQAAWPAFCNLMPHEVAETANMPGRAGPPSSRGSSPLQMLLHQVSHQYLDVFPPDKLQQVQNPCR